MKKFLLPSALLLSGMFFAQIDFSSTRFGVSAGANLSAVKNAHNPSGRRFTVQAGALALIPVGSTNQFFFQPEIQYFGAGETGKDKDAKGKDGYDAVYANDYLSVPISFKAYFSEAESEFFGLIGPRFNFLINQRVKDAPVSRPYYDPDVTVASLPNVNGKANSFNFGIGFGFGYSYKRQLEIAARYDFGLSNTYPGLDKEPNGTDKSKSEQVLSVSVNYIFR
ncbi:outer membrane beta-barrel protein [Chryseobacterium salviniae]|uniref:Outer membrane beta-barrel protein n=1 Tax=Chryseobacterium salviniae TaxID=3101750 RepID=A0ABU6HYZ2_9FLAO|nr:outer membrane beta-barrel protein [Chryseobacterium sp. T9W2-O]MEC3877583.1 outer membrane beta-barrel protein [Chryseobacterium sp. T9W2-O]